MDNGKIEERAISALSEIIDRHPSMQPDIKKLDKKMSWDGTITLFKDSDKSRSKENCFGIVDIQVKGHLDKAGKKERKNSVSVQVDVGDLRLYSMRLGCVYFQVYINEDGSSRNVYYHSFYASRINKFLKIAQRNKLKSVSIPFRKVSDYTELERILKQYLWESTQQGTGAGQIAQRVIKIDDLGRTEGIGFTSYFPDEKDMMEHIICGDICIYKVGETGISFPIEHPDNMRIIAVKIFKKEIIVGEKSYYNEYLVQRSSDDRYVMKIGTCIEAGKSELRFVPRGTLFDVCRDAEFIRAVVDNGEFYVGTYRIDCSNALKRLNVGECVEYFNKIAQALRQIEFYPDKPIKSFSDIEKRQVTVLYRMMSGEYDDKLEEDINVYNWRFGEKYIPLIIGKKAGCIKLTQLMGTKDIMVCSEKDKNTRIPLATVVDYEIFDKMYNYNEKWFENDFNTSQTNEKTAEYINEAGLRYLTAYDVTGNIRFLELARRAFDGASRYLDNERIIVLNQMQTNYRERRLNYEEINIIQSLDCKDDYELFGKAVLLRNIKEAEKYYIEMDEKTRDSIRPYPIMKLYKDLVNNKDARC